MFSQLSDKLQDIFKELRGHGAINELNIDAALRQIRLALLEADVDFQVAKKFIARVKEKALGEAVLRSITPGQQIVKIFYDELSIIKNLNDLLTGRDAAQNGFAERFFFDARDEFFRNLKIDIGFEQSEPNLAQRGIDV